MAINDEGLWGNIIDGFEGAAGGFISGGPLGAVAGAFRGAMGKEEKKKRRRRRKALTTSDFVALSQLRALGLTKGGLESVAMRLVRR